MYVKTERLELKPIGAEDLENLVELLTDETVKRTYMVPDFSGRTEAAKLARRLLELSREKDRIMVGIYLGDELMGILNETEIQGDQIELGYALLPRFHNRGIGTEALRGAIGFCFEKGYREVIAGAFEENLPSFRIMEKSGMTRLEKTEEMEYRGERHRCLYYGICKTYLPE